MSSNEQLSEEQIRNVFDEYNYHSTSYIMYCSICSIIAMIPHFMKGISYSYNATIVSMIIFTIWYSLNNNFYYHYTLNKWFMDNNYAAIPRLWMIFYLLYIIIMFIWFILTFIYIEKQIIDILLLWVVFIGFDIYWFYAALFNRILSINDRIMWSEKHLKDKIAERASV